MNTTIITIAAFAIAGILLLILREEIKYRKLAEIERERSAMLAIVSHRLRTPLTSIKWYTEMTLRKDFGKLTVAQVEVLHKILDGTDDSIKLLNTFLDVFHVEGDITLRPVSIDVQKSIGDIIVLLESIYKKKGHKITFNRKDGHLQVYVDPVILRSVLDSVLMNAAVYTPDNGSIHIDVTEEENNVVVTIKDSGIGISKKDEFCVFKKFYRGEQAKKVDSDGNGLSLYFVKELLKKSHGSIRFESHISEKEGSGTTFFITLPKS